jgi:HlyD family secretion protein
MISRKAKLILGMGIGLAVLVGLGIAFRPTDDSERFSWDAVNRGDIRETIIASGEIQAMTKINVGTSVMGEIKALHVKDGQDVKAGQLLVTIDQERLKQGLIQAEAALDGQRKDASRLEAGQAKARETFRRMESLHKQGLISSEDFNQAKLNQDSAELSFQTAKANVQQGIANLAAMRDALSKSVLVAPIAGRVTGLKAEKGETAIPGMSNLPGAVLMVISDMSDLIAEIKVNESEVVRLKLGKPAQVTVESFPGKVFQGNVREIATAAEKIGQDANMYRVKVALDMNTPGIDRLRPGMSARAVVLTAESKNVLRVPLQSVLEREGTLEDAQKKGLLTPETRNVVMVHKDGKVVEQPIVTAIANTQYYEVKEGLVGGEAVLTGPIRKLKELKDRAPVQLRKKSESQLEQEAKKKKEAKP